MKILHERTFMTDRSTTGTLSVDGVHFCVTLEDPVRETKIWGMTAIPEGKYRCSITWSHRFNRDMVMLNDVPGFDRIYAHCGNKAEDTNGCILVAERVLNADYIQGNSRKIEGKLTDLVKSRLSAGESVIWEIVSRK